MATITVGCKLPNGLHLDLNGRRVTLNGVNSSLVVGGYGLTEGVDEDFFNAWCKAYADNPAVKNGYVFAQAKPADAKAQAQEQAEIRTGLEPLDPEDPGAGLAPENPDELKRQIRKKAA